MRPWHWILASGVLLATVPARAQESSTPKPVDGAPATPKADPSAKAGRCAGKRGPVQGCTGFKASLRLRPEAQRARKADTAPHAPDLDASFIKQFRPDPPLQKQSDRLLKLELGRLEHLLSITPPNAPDRSVLIRRLADGYAELAARAQRQKLIAEEKVRAAERRTKSGDGRRAP